MAEIFPSKQHFRLKPTALGLRLGALITKQFAKRDDAPHVLDGILIEL